MTWSGPQVAFTVLLVVWRDDFLQDSASAYDDIHGHGTPGATPPDGGVPPYAGYESQPSYNQSSTADL
jgi:hypothetical protein